MPMKNKLNITDYGVADAAPYDLNCLQEDDMMELQRIRNLIEMDKRKRILQQHPYKITYNEKKKRWFTRFLNDDGKIVQKSHKDRKSLEDIIVRYYTGKINFDDTSDSYTFSQAHDKWLETQVEYGKLNNSIRRYETDWNRFFADSKFRKMNITDITAKDIEIFIIDNIRKFNLKRRGADGLYSCINGVFYNAVLDKRIKPDENPCLYVDKKKFVRFYNTDDKTPEQRTLSSDDLDKLIERINLDIERRSDYIYPYGVKLAILTGMRVGEIAGLRWCHVHDDYIRICESERYDVVERKYYQSKTKTGKIRNIPITQYIKTFLINMKELQAKFGIVDDFVLSFDNQKLRCKNLTAYMNHKSEQLFTDHKSIHAIRRTFNSYLRLDGVSATDAGNIIGNTPRVNDLHYTYDIQNMSTKNAYMENAEMRMIRASQI